ncbi:hypothetical protein ACFYPN_24170 [Streptomyces sp. NPDC005576]|uniref:hypothetical protein n=1 Tax=Streptomyces sp. NPDC005576 TaxID=3364726 RepID=UPI0036BB4889
MDEPQPGALGLCVGQQERADDGVDAVRTYEKAGALSVRPSAKRAVTVPSASYG